MDERSARACGQLRGNRIAVFAGALIENNICAQCLSGRDFRFGSIMRHHNGRRHPEPPRGPGHALRMVSAGNADNAACALFIG